MDLMQVLMEEYKMLGQVGKSILIDYIKACILPLFFMGRSWQS